jgi:hypothetical protein
MKNFVNASRLLVAQGDAFISKSGPLEFHKKAPDLLQAAQLHDLFDFKELVHSTFEAGFNKNQNYASAQFSDLPITVASGEHCFLDIYFWRRRPTVIHDHHFTGAFQCLEGANVDLEFEFIKSKQLGQFHDLGEVKLISPRQINRGDIAAIDLLDKFIHQNHHQAELTINVCFRTPDIGEINLSNYLYSGLRFEKHPDVLNRINRLMGFIHIGDFNVNELDLNLDDALNFLIRNYRSESRAKKFLELRTFLDQKVKDELGLDIGKMMDAHELKMDELENQYN